MYLSILIQLSDDDDEDDDDEVNDESSNLKLDKHKFNQLFTNEPLKLTYKTMLQKHQPTDFEYSSVPSTSQTEHQPLLCPHEEKDDNIDGSVFHGQVTKTLGLTCSECSKLIRNWSKLEKHLMKKHGKISFKCMVRGCNEQFVKRTLLNKHYTIHCSNRAKLACSTVDCHYEASNQKSFVNHLYKYHEKGLFQCVHCLETYSHRFMVDNHFKAKHKHPHDKANKHFRCPFCQNFRVFNSLPNEDQLALLKPAHVHVTSIWSAFHYDAQMKGFLTFVDESETNAIFIGTDILAQCFPKKIYHLLKNTSIGLYSALENDVNIRDLTCALALFKTERHLSYPENIRYHYHLYCSILQRYLLHKHQNKAEANQRYLALMHLLDQFDLLYEELRKFVQPNTENIPTVFLELYDLV